MLVAPEVAARSSQEYLFEKGVACGIGILSTLIANDVVAIFVDNRDYRIAITFMIDLFGILVLACYVVLYCLFIP